MAVWKIVSLINRTSLPFCGYIRKVSVSETDKLNAFLKASGLEIVVRKRQNTRLFLIMVLDPGSYFRWSRSGGGVGMAVVVWELVRLEGGGVGGGWRGSRVWVEWVVGGEGIECGWSGWWVERE